MSTNNIQGFDIHEPIAFLFCEIADRPSLFTYPRNVAVGCSLGRGFASKMLNPGYQVAPLGLNAASYEEPHKQHSGFGMMSLSHFFPRDHFSIYIAIHPSPYDCRMFP